jgi:hypothetical protein
MVNSQFSASTFGSCCYTDATARQYLIDTYGWTIKGGVFDGSKTIQGSNNADTLNTNTIECILVTLPTFQSPMSWLKVFA